VCSSDLGLTLQEIADEGEVTISTVRSQFKDVLGKTGCNRQAELVALLANIVPGRSEGA